MEQIKNTMLEASKGILASFNKLVNGLKSSGNHFRVGKCVRPASNLKPAVHAHPTAFVMAEQKSLYLKIIAKFRHLIKSMRSRNKDVLCTADNQSSGMTCAIRNSVSSFPFTIYNSQFTIPRPAFTLAEVLITLGIIGVVAAITIPSLMKNWQDLQYKSAYKKAFSDASNIWQIMAANNEVTGRDAIYSDVAPNANFTVFMGYFKVAKSCGFSGNSNSECWDFSGGKFAAGGTVYVPDVASNLTYAAFIDMQGRQWMKNRSEATFGDVIYVDTNGFKGPNKFGKDRFHFYPSLSTCASSENNADDNCRGIGTPVIMRPFYQDTSNTKFCNVENCYYKTWLFN